MAPLFEHRSQWRRCCWISEKTGRHRYHAGVYGDCESHRAPAIRTEMIFDVAPPVTLKGMAARRPDNNHFALGKPHRHAEGRASAALAGRTMAYVDHRWRSSQRHGNSAA
jgi:hypothetical protein